MRARASLVSRPRCRAAGAGRDLRLRWCHWGRRGWAVGVHRAYAGTSALKGDFTRTGRRTQLGVMADGVNALTRFYKNNFLDRDRQLLIGAAPRPAAGRLAPRRRRKP